MSPLWKLNMKSLINETLQFSKALKEIRNHKREDRERIDRNRERELKVECFSFFGMSEIVLIS